MINIALELKNMIRKCEPASSQYTNPAKRKTSIRRSLSIMALVLLACLSLRLSLLTDSFTAAAADRQAPSSDRDAHPYHDGPPQAPLPPILDSKQFTGIVVQNAYRLAVELKDVLYQQPCYCHCAHHLGHTSLLDCYTSTHTSGCGICLKELYYIYEQASKGQSTAQIRDAIIRGNWKSLDLSKYEKPLSKKVTD